MGTFPKNVKKLLFWGVKVGFFWLVVTILVCATTFCGWQAITGIDLLKEEGVLEPDTRRACVWSGGASLILLLAFVLWWTKPWKIWKQWKALRAGTGTLVIRTHRWPRRIGTVCMCGALGVLVWLICGGADRWLYRQYTNYMAKYANTVGTSSAATVLDAGQAADVETPGSSPSSDGKHIVPCPKVSVLLPDGSASIVLPLLKDPWDTAQCACVPDWETLRKQEKLGPWVEDLSLLATDEAVRKKALAAGTYKGHADTLPRPAYYPENCQPQFASQLPRMPAWAPQAIASSPSVNEEDVPPGDTGDAGVDAGR